MKRALIYCRVSTKGQESNSSLKTQEDICKKYAKEQGYKVERITKEAFSGADFFERPLLCRDRSDIRAGKFDAFIIDCIDRLGRNIAGLAIVDEECRKAKCDLVFVTEPLDRSAEGKLIGSVRAYMAEVERLKIRERTMRGRRAKILSGKPVLNAPPLFGYINDKENQCYKIVESEAQIVRKIFQLAIDGYGVRHIAKKLNDDNIPSQAGSIWSGGVISNVINNPAYKGIAYANVYGLTEDHKTIKRPQSEWIKLDDGVRPPIVEPVIWDRVQLLKSQKRQFESRNDERFLLLRGLVYCESCEWKMYPIDKIDRKPNGNTYPSKRYRCGLRYSSTNHQCQNSMISVKKIDAIVWGKISAMLRDPKEIERTLEDYFKTRQADDLTADIDSVKNQLAKTERGLQRLLTSFRQADDILLPHLEREIYLATREKESLQGTLKLIEEKASRVKVSETGIRELKQLCQQYSKNLDLATDEQKRKILLMLGVRVNINRAIITIEYTPTL